MPVLAEQLRDLVVEVGGMAKDFDSQANLYLDLGMPSVKAMQLLMELEGRFGVCIPDDQFVEATSLASLTTLMQGLLGDGTGAGNGN